MDARIVVVGSINMDLAVRCPHIPSPGETILGSSLIESPGGKGANQAVAAGRLGGSVAMVGCLGNDSYGAALRESLTQAGVDVRHVLTCGDRSGVALIEVADNGENSIVVVPGANGLLTADNVAAALHALGTVQIVLLQLEIPLPTVIAAARLARARGAQVILDPAPAPSAPLPDELLQQIDILTPNQGEAGLLAGLPVASLVEARAAARRLLARGSRTIAIKLGADGVLIVDREGDQQIPGFRVNAVDTTAAGDCLAGALAVALVEGMPLMQAVTFANTAAALSTTRAGAQVSMPSRSEVDQFVGT